MRPKPRLLPVPGSVADMPPRLRQVCEQMCAGRSEIEAAQAMGIKLGTFRANLCRARAFTGTHSRASLVEWCKSGGSVRKVTGAPQVVCVTVRNADGLMTDVMVDSAFQVLMEAWPERFLANAAKLREKRERAAAQSRLNVAMDAANAADETRRNQAAAVPTDAVAGM